MSHPVTPLEGRGGRRRRRRRAKKKEDRRSKSIGKHRRVTVNLDGLLLERFRNKLRGVSLASIELLNRGFEVLFLFLFALADTEVLLPYSLCVRAAS